MAKPKRILTVHVLAGMIAISALLASPLGAVASAAGASASSWKLEDYQQSACFSSHVTDAYYGVYIEGTWRRQINVGARGLPQGGTYDTTYAPIPPGSSNGEYTLAYVHVNFQPVPPVGTYSARLWASNGRIAQSVPITMVVQTKCGY